jgi:DNA polymerase sigma
VFDPRASPNIPWAVSSFACMDRPGPASAVEVGRPSALVHLHNEILALCALVSPSEQEIAARASVLEEVRRVAARAFPTSPSTSTTTATSTTASSSTTAGEGVVVRAFGSHMTNILTPSSDLDLVSE